MFGWMPGQIGWVRESYDNREQQSATGIRNKCRFPVAYASRDETLAAWGTSLQWTGFGAFPFNPRLIT
jgi:hypothetical protein